MMILSDGKRLHAAAQSLLVERPFSSTAGLMQQLRSILVPALIYCAGRLIVCLIHMQKVGGLYERLLPPSMGGEGRMFPMHSTVLGETISDPETLDATYWRRNLESPILFSRAIHECLDNSP